MTDRPLPTWAEPEFYPADSGRDPASGFSMEIRPTDEHRGGGYEITMWRNRSGSSFQVVHPTIEKARRVARVLYHLHAADYAEQRRQDEILYTEMSSDLKARSDEREATEAADHAARLAQVTAETERIEMTICPTCDHAADAEEFEQPVYECSRCGGSQVGEGENRCVSCNVFMSKVGDLACPSCEEPVEEPETVTGVEIDGVFIPESELDNPTIGV